MPNPRTPSTSDFSTLGRQERNDNVTTQNTVPEYPNRSDGNEFEVEKMNEVYPNQTPNHEVKNDGSESSKKDKMQSKDKTDTKNNDDEDWDVTKQNEMNPEKSE